MAAFDGIARSDLTAARSYLLGQLGLSGPYLDAAQHRDQAPELGMIQIDSIRVCGLRNHEIAWAARGGATVQDYYDLLYRDRALIETHYPLFATRRDWLPWFLKDFHKAIGNRERLSELRPLMRKMKRHIRENGPASPADFDSERVIGGFNTIKATTKALEYLYYVGEVQISGRTKHFHRVFDLTERVLPELSKPFKPTGRELESFAVRSAAKVLRLASRDQLARRAAHHLGTWRSGLPQARKAVDRAIHSGDVVAVEFAATPKGEPYFTLPEELARKLPDLDDTVRLIPPLDNLMFSRHRFTDLFGFTFKFEAYTPEQQRRFYFALPIIYRDDVVGLLDAKKDGDSWRIVGLDLMKPVPLDRLREAVHRLAAIAGAREIKCDGRLPLRQRRALNGACEIVSDT